MSRLEGECDEAFERRFEEWGAGDAAQLGSFCHPAARVLEIGCGIGRILKHVVAGERWGCDVSQEMLRLARTYLGEGVRLVHINGIDLAGIPDDYSDLVYSVLVFQHISKRAGYILLCETRRVLKPGGHFFLEFMNLLNEQAFQRFLQILRLPYPLEPYTPDEVRYKVAKAGLGIDDLYLRGEGIYVVGRKPGP